MVGASARASAQAPSIDARTWRPSTDPNASLVIEPAVTPGPGVLSVGGYAHYALNPVSLKRAGSDDVALRPVQHVLGLDAVANLGIGQRFALGLAVPVILYQDGTRPLPATVAPIDATPSSGIGDLGISLKGSFIRNENGGFGLAGLGYFTLPTGDRAGFMGEGSVTGSVRVLAEYTLIVAVAQASLGYKLRTEDRVWPAASAGGYRFGDEVPWSLGIALRPGVLGVDSGNRQRWEVAAHGWLPAGRVGPFGAGDPGSAALSPVLLAMSDRIELGHYRDAYMLAGVEIGLTEAVGVPAFRGVLSIGWAPREHDMDHDGVKDDVDGCPEIPEDKDGFEDSDGCPEIDNDDDGIIDKEDACPNVKGSPSSDPKKNGCPMNDQDGDGIEDAVDACPTVKGVNTDDPRTSGCPAQDSDGDGIPDALDKCPTQPEDKDGFQDDDGCPDPDNDGDGVADKDDACPDVAGEPNTDPARNGCPNDDRDGDTIPNAVDKCPDSAEVFNGVDDEDGCPDEGGKALVVVDDKRNLKLAQPIKLVGGDTAPDVDPASIPTLRALALELNRHRDWTLAVGVRPAGGDPSKAQLDALTKSFAIVRVLAGFAHRDGAAESIAWDAVKTKPGAESGVGLVLVASSAPAAAAPPATTPAATSPAAAPAATPPAPKP
ncbi:MAG: thrombospondin type 3 repeat-containing protein [Deltaproteobacteria bacterium]|nr:thrombospondin type 3 repeat-containing protein [Deltaproteobacteria bacterium]